MNTRHLSALLLALTSAPAILHAEEPVPVPLNEVTAVASPDDAFRFSLHWENDSAPVKPNNRTDRYYTNGAGFTLSLRNDFAVEATNWIPFGADFDQKRRAVGFTAAQLMFTPDNISLDTPDPTDRPYAGYLYGGFFFQRSNDFTLDHIQLDIGIVGNSSLADSAQIEVHDFFDQEDPRGWDSQLEDEPTIQLYLRKAWRWEATPLELNDIPPVRFQLIPEAELAVGTVHRYAKAGVMFRAGFYLPDDFGPDQLLHIGSFTGQGTTHGWGGYIFGRVSGKAVEHNLFIEGNNWESSAGVDEEALVGEAQVGIALQWRCGDFSFDLTYSQTFVTEEFENQEGHHEYGAFSAALVWRF